MNPFHWNNPPFHWDNPFNETLSVIEYGATGDGTTNDKAAIEAALTAALANLPATVYFPPGDYAIESGITIEMTQADRGLSIRGAGADVSRIKITGTGAWSVNWHALKIAPSSDPSFGDTDNYLRDILIQDIGFYDDDPEGHAAPLTITGSIDTGVSATTVNLSGSFTEADNTYIRINGAGVAGASLVTEVTAGTGTSTLTIGTAASTDVTDAVIYGTKTGTSEETHGINVQYGYGVKIINCNFEEIGDESVELDYCEDAIITGNKFINCPAAELSGGSAISIKNGCEMVTASNNVIDGYGAGAYNVYGINLKVVLNDPVKNITISDNVIRNHNIAGLHINAAGTGTNSNVVFSGNVIDGCDAGVQRRGNNPVEFFSIMNNVITNGALGLNLQSSAASNLDLNICFNTIDTMSSKGIFILATRANLSGNNVSNTSNIGIDVDDGTDINITGGVMDSCGGTNIADIDMTGATNTTVNGVVIQNTNATSYVIKAVENVRNCTINRAAPLTSVGLMIGQVKNVTGCTLTGGIRPDGAATGGVIANNTITYGVETGGANSASRLGISLVAGNTDYVITGNVVDTSNSTNNQYPIQLATGNTGCIITGNVIHSLGTGAANGLNDVDGNALTTAATDSDPLNVFN